MREVTISEFRVKCCALIEQVCRSRQPIRITRNGKPIAEIVPPKPVVNRKAWIGSMRGSFDITGDII